MICTTACELHGNRQFVMQGLAEAMDWWCLCFGVLQCCTTAAKRMHDAGRKWFGCRLHATQLCWCVLVALSRHGILACRWHTACAMAVHVGGSLHIVYGEWDSMYMYSTTHFTIDFTY
jgi:hypothetical protein